MHAQRAEVQKTPICPKNGTPTAKVDPKQEKTVAKATRIL
jgi:hypothetical protein